MNRGENSLITDGSRSRLDMSDQLWSLFIAGLGEMHLISDPQGSSFLAIAGVLVIMPLALWGTVSFRHPSATTC